jgi:uncharacterized membrane protein (DUF373 family)
MSPTVLRCPACCRNPEEITAFGGGCMKDYYKKFEKVIVLALLVMMSIVVLLATIELAYILAKDIFSPPLFILEIEELLELFGLFLLVLIGVELLETVRAYLAESVVHAHVVFMVAIIAIGRKVIILDIYKLKAETLIGIAAIVIALSLGYFLVRRVDERRKRGN